jgi:hypothetical protein
VPANCVRGGSCCSRLGAAGFRGPVMLYFYQ